MKKNLSIVGVGIVIILGLFFVFKNQASNVKSSEHVSSESHESQKHQPVKKVVTTKKHTSSKLSESSQSEKVNRHKQASKQVIALEKNNNEALSQAITTQMATVLPSTHGPARWTAYVEEVGGQGLKTSVTNWEPAKSQFSASTIKLFILIRYYQLCQSGQLNPDDTYVLQKKDMVQGSGTMLNDPVGTKYTLQELCNLMIEQSDNIATNVLIDEVGGFSAVNRTITSVVGPKHQSSLERKMMDTSNIENGRANRINAKEAAQTLLQLYQGKVIDPTTDAQMLSLMLKTKNRTKLPSQLPAGAICYNKSGESNYRGIENDMALIKYNGHVFAMCVLIEMDGEGETPIDATIEQTQSEVNAIGNIGQAVTNVIAAS
ncbi:serine hydrolase [Latilactobacillus sakei]|uniref:serine hydrolase n=1 Tax=Latilactobacillus sakei TaxID=1599 RepID=UPI000DC644E1|nr:serine hydrolase [Latilactobacillus sakei]MCP8856440.1 class A beta-lactamase-related serine hydrolase [Latilactobacillus sakei]SPS07562.1 Beta-lactamase precursor [Latilactobacillus sakei]